jgi:hypothetical protein
MTKKNMVKVSKILMALSLAGVIMAGFGYLIGDVWLASTQWLLIAAVLGLFGVYLRES